MTSVLSFRNLCASIQQECMASPFRTYAILFEEKTKLNVAYLVLAKGFVLITLLLADVGTSLIVNVVGFMYPAYKTLSSMGQMDSESKRKGKSSSEAVSVSCSSTSYWLMYWIIYNSFGLVESSKYRVMCIQLQRIILLAASILTLLLTSFICHYIYICSCGV